MGRQPTFIDNTVQYHSVFFQVLRAPAGCRLPVHLLFSSSSFVRVSTWHFKAAFFLTKFLRWNSSVFNWRRRKCRPARRSFPGSTVHIGWRKCRRQQVFLSARQLYLWSIPPLFLQHTPAYKLRQVIGLKIFFLHYWALQIACFCQFTMSFIRTFA